MSEFELHVRAILGLPIGEIVLRSPGASAVILSGGEGVNPRFEGVEGALSDPRNRLRLFAKPDARRFRRMGVVTTYGANVDEARRRASAAAGSVRVVLDEG
jgi:phosphoribosylglycinamide formyltransferase 2